MTVTPALIMESLWQLEFDGTFNPYKESCSVHDRIDSPDIRSSILLEILEKAADTKVDAIWIGRDLGHKGGRRTGLALTDDLSFEKHLARWELDVERPTAGTPVKERTATVIWDMLDQISEQVFLWNVFPLHPYPIAKEFSNRAHTAKERRAGEQILRLIFELILPERIVAIGNDAANVARGLWADADIHQVRHPSYGGQIEFCASIQQLYEFEHEKRQVCLI